MPGIDGRFSRQGGLSLVGFLLVVMVAGLLGSMVLRLVPVYLNHYKIKASLESIRSQPDLAMKTRGDIMGSLQKRWDIDTVNDVTSDDVTVTKAPGELQIRVVYDVVRPFVGNIELLVHFDETIEAEFH